MGSSSGKNTEGAHKESYKSVTVKATREEERTRGTRPPRHAMLPNARRGKVDGESVHRMASHGISSILSADQASNQKKYINKKTAPAPAHRSIHGQCHGFLASLSRLRFPGFTTLLSLRCSLGLTAHSDHA